MWLKELVRTKEITDTIIVGEYYEDDPNVESKTRTFRLEDFK